MRNIDFLNRISLFKQFTNEELEGIQHIFQEQEYKKNQVVFVEEETGKYMYIVKYGEVKVVQSSSEGRENILAIHGSGETFGEMSLLDGLTTPATVVAKEDCRIITISKHHFDTVLMKNPKAVVSLLLILCHRLRDAWDNIQVLKYTDAETRIRHILINLADSGGSTPEPEGNLINTKITHQELAELAGTSRETVSRLISRLQQNGTLKIKNHKFLLITHPYWRNV